MLIYVDIDNTICRTYDGDYKAAEPLRSRITRLNLLYDQGHTIVYFSGRGVLTRTNWLSLTKSQFKKWGVKYHNIILAKPPWDLLIDDKAMSDKHYFKDTA